jgi:methylated-DNA-[protein]-cysteine S-methyltransferase
VIGSVVVAAPWGPIHLAADEDALLALELTATEASFAASCARRLGGPLVARAACPPALRRRLDAASAAVRAYLAGDPRPIERLPIRLVGLSAWDRRVLDGVRTIPPGAVTSYGRLARIVGRPGAARAVGGAVGRNPIGLAIPCHRVIAGDGTLGGYGGGWFGGREALLELKRTLLAGEGIALPARELTG